LPANLSTNSLTTKLNVQRVHILPGLRKFFWTGRANYSGRVRNCGRSCAGKYIIGAASADPWKADVSHYSPEEVSLFSLRTTAEACPNEILRDRTHHAGSFTCAQLPDPGLGWGHYSRLQHYRKPDAERISMCPSRPERRGRTTRLP
jgi:hypothetical protein